MKSNKPNLDGLACDRARIHSIIYRAEERVHTRGQLSGTTVPSDGNLLEQHAIGRIVPSDVLSQQLKRRRVWLGTKDPSSSTYNAARNDGKATDVRSDIDHRISGT
jgi:hypothetical protein